MGMFDTIHVTCPQCGGHVDEQTKEGDCLLRDYTLETMPKDLLIRLNGYMLTCENGHNFKIRTESTVLAKLVLEGQFGYEI